MLTVLKSAFSQDLLLTEEELAAYRITLYSDNEQIPLEGLLTINGLPFDSSELFGKYVFINIGATWCPFCNREKPSIEKLFNIFVYDNFRILAIYAGERVFAVRQYTQTNNYSFPAAIDPTDRLRNEYAPRIPTSYILNPDGYIIARINGNKVWDSDVAVTLLRTIIGQLPIR